MDAAVRERVDGHRNRDVESGEVIAIDGGRDDVVAGGTAIGPGDELVIEAVEGLAGRVDDVIESDQGVLNERRRSADAGEINSEAAGLRVEGQIHFFGIDRDGLAGAKTFGINDAKNDFIAGGAAEIVARGGNLERARGDVGERTATGMDVRIVVEENGPRKSRGRQLAVLDVGSGAGVSDGVACAERAAVDGRSNRYRGRIANRDADVGGEGGVNAVGNSEARNVRTGNLICVDRIGLCGGRAIPKGPFVSDRRAFRIM